MTLHGPNVSEWYTGCKAEVTHAMSEGIASTHCIKPDYQNWSQRKAASALTASKAEIELIFTG